MVHVDDFNVAIENESEDALAAKASEVTVGLVKALEDSNLRSSKEKLGVLGSDLETAKAVTVAIVQMKKQRPLHFEDRLFSMSQGCGYYFHCAQDHTFAVKLSTLQFP